MSYYLLAFPMTVLNFSGLYSLSGFEKVVKFHIPDMLRIFARRSTIKKKDVHGPWRSA